MEAASPYYQLAHDFATMTNRSIFLTGKAGTGKTTFLRRLHKETQKQMAIVAPTGVAAINAGGTTMHSFFQLPFTPFVPTAEGRKNLLDKLKMQGNRRKVLQELELLVIDEISMVRADVLDAVDTILRHVRYRNHEPFGGVQMIFIGDMFQLSPVATDDELRLLSQYYKSLYFFHSQCIYQQAPLYIELDKIFRQQNAEFIQLLNEVRNNSLTEKGLAVLQSRYNPFFVPPSDDTFITLTTHNYKADQINAEELGKIKGKIYSFEAIIEGDYPEKSYPTERELVLKAGAKVMFLKNDTETPRRFFNGKIGVVEQVDNDFIQIKCPDDAESIQLRRAVWENIRYTTNPETKQIEEKELGKFTQFPLRLAWAITIHKSQGLTFDKAVIDAGAAFASGQVYVALSRCRSLEGLVLLSKIHSESIHNDRLIVEHEQSRLPLDELEFQLEKSKNEYRTFVLLQLFDFRSPVGQTSRLIKEVTDAEKSFNDETLPFLNDVLRQLQGMQEVAARFQNQLLGIIQQLPVNELFLQERIDAAIDFFNEKTQLLADTLRQSPATSDSRQHAVDYNDAITTIFSALAQKQYLLTGLRGSFSVESYFTLKNIFRIPDFAVNAYAKTATKPLQTRQPRLLHQLIELRNRLCEPSDMPIYLVAGTKTLVEMSDYLPLSAKDLLQISGFGQARVEKYGAAFLEVINKFCIENHLSSLIHEKVGKSKEKAPKKEVGETMRISLQMFREGKSIEEIALSRNLVQSTIIKHLEKYIISSELDIDLLVSPEKRERALAVFRSDTESAILFETLGEFMTYAEIKFFLVWKRSFYDL